MTKRELRRTIESVATADGAGVKLRRSLGSVRGLYLDPFLMLREPIVQYGPFVMNTREEVEQAVRDYRNGTLTDARTEKAAFEPQ